MLLNTNSNKETIIIKRLSNGERFKMKFEAGLSKEYCKKLFMESYNAKNKAVSC